MISVLLPITVKEKFEEKRKLIVKKFGYKLYDRLMAMQVSRLEMTNVLRYLAECSEDENGHGNS
jgi:hypothetical protein